MTGFESQLCYLQAVVSSYGCLRTQSIKTLKHSKCWTYQLSIGRACWQLWEVWSAGSLQLAAHSGSASAAVSCLVWGRSLPRGSMCPTNRVRQGCKGPVGCKDPAISAQSGILWWAVLTPVPSLGWPKLCQARITDKLLLLSSPGFFLFLLQVLIPNKYFVSHKLCVTICFSRTCK